VPLVLLVLVGVTQVVQTLAHRNFTDPIVLFHRFLPPHDQRPGHDPFALIEQVLTGIAQNQGAVSLYAVIAFIWFSTRLFAGVRVSLNDIFDVSVRPTQQRHFLLNWLAAKLRDALMVIATVVLFLVNTAITIAVLLLRRQGRHWIPALSFVVTWAGRTVVELVAFIFAVSLFMITYKYASVRRLPWRTALLASTFTAVLFEVAKRVYSLYLGHFANLGGPSGNANIGAAVLFILWVYYTAIVFLLGGVVAETWELRTMQRRQRAILN